MHAMIDAAAGLKKSLSGGGGGGEGDSDTFFRPQNFWVNIQGGWDRVKPTPSKRFFG